MGLPGRVAFLLAVRWLAAHGGQRFFLFLHTYEVHHPYRPSAEDLAALGPPYEGDLPPSISLELLREINSGRRPLEPGDLEFIRERTTPRSARWTAPSAAWWTSSGAGTSTTAFSSS